MHFDQHVSLLWPAHIELKKCVWYFYFNIWLFFNHILNFKVVLLNKVFIVDAISQEKRKKSKIQDILLGFITYTSNIIFKFHEKPTEYQPRINYWEIRTQTKTLNQEKKLEISQMCLHFTTGKAVLQSHWRKPFDTVLLVSIVCMQFVRNYVEKVKCSTCEYVAIYVEMEGASTSKKRKEEIKQRKESFTGNTTQLFNDWCLKCNATWMMIYYWQYFSQT